MKTLPILLVLGLLAVAAAAAALWYRAPSPVTSAIASYDECVRAGYPVLESYPPQCRTPDGHSFTLDIGNELEKSDLIRITAPRPAATVTSPLRITGEARGSWFFEASFPIHLEDAAGTRVATTVAQAQGEWMTSEFVPFQATLSIPPGVTGPATLILERDNPSGLPEHADALRLPLTIQAAP